jgi:4-amino-4-deoxychorismate lyase
LPHYSRERLTQGIKLHVCRQRLAHNTVLAGIKHLNRLEQVLAASELQADVADEGLMLDVSGAVIEGISSNIFIVRGDALLTPSLHQCGVAGVMRATILQSLAQEADFTVQELRLTLADCLQADAIFCCNSIFGIAPVRAIGVSTIKNKKTVIDALWQLLAKLGYARLYD